MNADRIVLGTVNASLSEAIDAAALAGVLRGEFAPRWDPHLEAFFTEVPLDAIEAFAAAHRIEIAQLSRAYARVRDARGARSPDVDDWLGYLEAAPA